MKIHAFAAAAAAILRDAFCHSSKPAHIEELRYMHRKPGEAWADKISGVVGLEQFSIDSGRTTGFCAKDPPAAKPRTK